MAGTPLTPTSFRSVAWGICVSLAFWATLLMAAACFAAVSLSPKLWQWQRSNDQFAANQHHLAAVEEQTLRLQRVVAALNEDPAFVEELARVEFDAFRPGEETIPVDPPLRLHSQAAAVESAQPRRAVSSWQPMLILLAGDRQIRTSLLVAAAALVIVAFTWLQESTDSPGASAESNRQTSWWLRLRLRYRQQ